MAVKRRVIWMRDDEWDALKQIAADRGDTVSGVIRDFWQVAATHTPVAPGEVHPPNAIPLPTYEEWIKDNPGKPTATIRVLDAVGREVVAPVTLEIPAPDEEDLFAEPKV